MAFNEILAKTWYFQTLEPEVDWWLYSLSWCWKLHLGGKVQVDGWCQSQGSRVPGVWVSVKRLEALLLSENLSGYESKLEFETTLFIILYRMLNRKESTQLYIQLRLSHFSLGRASMAITVTNRYTTNRYIWDARLALPFGPWYHPGLNKQMEYNIISYNTIYIYISNGHVPILKIWVFVNGKNWSGEFPLPQWRRHLKTSKDTLSGKAFCDLVNGGSAERIQWYP